MEFSSKPAKLFETDHKTARYNGDVYKPREESETKIEDISQSLDGGMYVSRVIKVELRSLPACDLDVLFWMLPECEGVSATPCVMVLSYASRSTMVDMKCSSRTRSSNS